MAELKLGFIGLGNMGAPMARKLLEAGFDVTVTDLDPVKVDALVALGAGQRNVSRLQCRGKDVGRRRGAGTGE